MLVAPSRAFGGHAANTFKTTVAAAMFNLTVLVWLGAAAFQLPSSVVAWFGISGVLGLAFGDTAYLVALKHIGPTTTAVVYQSSALFALVLGITLLDERLTVMNTAGVVLVIAGVLLATVRKRKPGEVHGSWKVGLFAATLAAVGQATGIYCTNRGWTALEAAGGTRDLHGAVIASTLRMTAASLGTLLGATLQGSLPRSTLPLRRSEGWRRLFFPMFIGTYVAMVLMQVSLANLPSGLAAVLLSTTPIFTVPVAWWLIGDVPHARGAIGAVVAVGGAALLCIA